MSEVMMKDCGIKLFGKTIYLLPDKAVSAMSVPEQSECSSSSSISQDSKDASRGESTGSKHEFDDSNNISTEEPLTEAATSSDISTDDPNTPIPEKNSSEPSENSDSEEKTLKKPDKIIPCPRCNSMETKFCYYNNYNVNQPRYFCKNCQRYWTSGGTMRNVPVGSGRRKNKSSLVPNYRHVMIPDAQNGIHLPVLNQNGVLIFGEPSERSPNCDTNEFYEHSSRSMGPSGFPVAFYPVTPYWASSPGPNASPNLGKHSREGKMLFGKESVNGEKKSVLVPKTLRFDDPNEAAKSSIWSTLGIKNEKSGSINGSGPFRAFGSSKGEIFGGVNNAVMVLQANPAALSRSVNFQESV